MAAVLRGHPRAVTWALVLGAALSAGCPESDPQPAPPQGDAGPADGDTLDPAFDSDMDGLCNETELTRSTDPFVPDTDEDGYSDWVEVAFGYDPVLPASPERGDVFILHEGEAAGLQVPISVIVRGRGEDYYGAFEAQSARNALGITAADFHTDSVAVFANPPENVAEVQEEAERFRIVVGLTELEFEVRFAFGDNLVRRCLHAYPFRYTVKRSDGRILRSERRLLVVVPDGETFGGSEWCTPSPPCL